MVSVGEVALGENEVLSVFPNPSKGNVKVTFKDGVDNADMTVYDNMGRVIINTMNVNEIESVLNNLSSGVYTVQVNSEKGNQVLKVVLTK